MVTHGFQPEWKNLLRQGLQDDGWPWDWTSAGVPAKGGDRVRAQVIAKSAGIWACSGLVSAAQALAEELASAQGLSRVALKSKLQDGDAYRKGDVLVEWSGSGRLILALERPFLNLAAYACGIATQTGELVRTLKKALPKGAPRVVPTRKTLPHYRDLAVHAVRAGGGIPHRVGLSSGVLIKENHIAAAGSIARAVESARAVAPHLCKIEVEVRDPRELQQAIDAQADVVLLDNFSPRDVKRALHQIEQSLHRPLVEISGGIDSGNVRAYAIRGVDVVSVGSITHSVKSQDFSLLVIPSSRG